MQVQLLNQAKISARDVPISEPSWWIPIKAGEPSQAFRHFPFANAEGYIHRLWANLSKFI